MWKGHCQKSTLTEDKKKTALKQKQKSKERLLPFVTTYHPAVQDLKETLMANWSLIFSSFVLIISFVSSVNVCNVAILISCKEFDI